MWLEGLDKLKTIDSSVGALFDCEKARVTTIMLDCRWYALLLTRTVNTPIAIYEA
jgi:hypothetical protein